MPGQANARAMTQTPAVPDSTVRRVPAGVFFVIGDTDADDRLARRSP